MTNRSVQCFFVVCIILVGFARVGRAQESIALLHVKDYPFHPINFEENTTDPEGEPFEYDRNLIFFNAEINGQNGQFILDTGAPTLLLNTRNVVKEQASNQHIAMGAQGAVNIVNEKVESFEMSGRTMKSRWVLGMDLRPMEKRINRRIDGYVGYEMLRNGELRIDYQNQYLALLTSTRRPTHEGRSPTYTLKFEFVDHLPVVSLRVNGRKMRFAIDTGAGVNVIDDRFVKTHKLTTPTGIKINIQGLDGKNAIQSIVRMEQPETVKTTAAQSRFVAMDLSHLTQFDDVPITGILGSPFLSYFTVGIDYRRRKLYLW